MTPARAPQQQLALLLRESHPAAFRVRESTRAKRMSIHVSPHAGVEVVVPRRTSPVLIERFVREHRDWIEQTSESLGCRAGPAMDLRLPERIELRASGRSWKVHYERTAGAVRLTPTRHSLLLRGGTGDEAACRERLRRWLSREARRHLQPALDRLCRMTGLQYEQLQIRGQRTRWGSCSSQGTISLNYCLMFLAPELVRYLLVHELCHTRYMSHGPRFWSLVARHEPECRPLDAQMDEAWRDVPGWVMLTE